MRIAFAFLCLIAFAIVYDQNNIIICLVALAICWGMLAGGWIQEQIILFRVRKVRHNMGRRWNDVNKAHDSFDDEFS